MAASDRSYNLRPLLVLNSYLCSRSTIMEVGGLQFSGVRASTKNLLNSTNMEGGALEGVRWGQTHSTDSLNAL